MLSIFLDFLDCSLTVTNPQQGVVITC